MITLANASSMFDAARQYFRRESDVTSEEAPTLSQMSEMPDQSRYARILENELDRRHLSRAEREDMEVFDRVRSALYED